MKYVERGAAESVRKLPCCYVRADGSPCGRLPCDAAHVLSRGAGEVTIPENLVPLCREHHTTSHYSGEPKATVMLEYASERTGIPADAILRAVYRIRTLDDDRRAAEAIVKALRGQADHRPGQEDVRVHGDEAGPAPDVRPAGVAAGEDSGWLDF